MPKAKNVLVTGAMGFTARHLVARLRQAEENLIVTGIGRSEASNPAGFDWYFPADLTDYAQALQVVRETKPEQVFHMAGLTRGNASDLCRINLIGTVNLLEAVKLESPQSAVLAVGSAAEYGVWPPEEMPLSETHECKPVGPYGLSKYMGTLAAQDYARNGVKVVVARPFNIVGAGMPSNLVAGAIVQRARAALLENQSSISVGNAHTVRDFVAVEDAVDAYAKLIQSNQWGEVFNICSGEGTSIQTIIEILLSFSPKPIEVTVDEALRRPTDAPVVVGDFGKARRACGFAPKVPLRKALRNAWDALMELEAPVPAGKN